MQPATPQHGKIFSPQNHASFTDSPAEIAEHFELAARATNDALRVWDVTAGHLSWPQGLETLLGYERSIISSEIGFWERHLHPEDRTHTTANIRDALARHGGGHWSGEYRFRKTDGTYLLLLERALIERDENGNAVRWIGSLMDITARRQLQDQLCRSQRMEAFGQLAGGLAHDFNNFLTTILGYSDLLLADSSLKAKTTKQISEIRNAAGRASALSAQLLAFSRKHPLEPRVLDVNPLLVSLEESLLRLLGATITVECDLPPSADTAHIRVDRNQITQIILNLAVNARDAMPNGGRLSLTSAVVTLPADAGEQLAPGEYVTISVRDNGSGMTPEVKARLFEPFFTTKESSRRSGLGLATSYGIVQQSGGDIRVESEVGCGTTVTIYLPRVPAPGYRMSNAKQLPTGTETVLVLEDDISVRHLAVRVLRGLGYDVIEAANSDDAQRAIAAGEHRRVDLLLTDIVLPKMSGNDFADWLRQTQPQVRVVFISGYLDESLGHGAEKDFLPKPFDPTQLALTVRAALDA